MHDKNFNYGLDNEQILTVNPELACAIGLKESIVLRQVHYWLTINQKTGHNIHEDKVWVFNSIKNWMIQFPFWSEKTLVKAFKSLEKNELLLVGNFNRVSFDRTKWYTIDYDKLSLFLTVYREKESHFPLGKNDQMHTAEMGVSETVEMGVSETVEMGVSETVEMGVTIPETTQRLTKDYTETKKNKEKRVTPSDVYNSRKLIFDEIVGFLNEKADKKFSAKSEVNFKHINARLNDGWIVDDFKHVIEVKTEEWKDNPQMNKYLRPSTLFSKSHFEEYLNQSLQTKKELVSTGWDGVD